MASKLQRLPAVVPRGLFQRLTSYEEYRIHRNTGEKDLTSSFAASYLRILENLLVPPDEQNQRWLTTHYGWIFHTSKHTIYLEKT